MGSLVPRLERALMPNNVVFTQVRNGLHCTHPAEGRGRRGREEEEGRGADAEEPDGQHQFTRHGTDELTTAVTVQLCRWNKPSGQQPDPVSSLLATN